jgi:hypothetical protein
LLAHQVHSPLTATSNRRLTIVDLRITSPHAPENNISTPGSKINGSEHSAFLDVHQFFLPMKANFDQGQGYDPIDIGLVTKEEASTLLA